MTIIIDQALTFRTMRTDMALPRQPDVFTHTCDVRIACLDPSCGPSAEPRALSYDASNPKVDRASAGSALMSLSSCVEKNAACSSEKMQAKQKADATLHMCSKSSNACS
eukprot:3501019-Amphidinium_carterae.1